MGLLLRHRGRSGLTQRDLATRVGTTRRSIQDWESGAYYPSAERLQQLIRVLLESGGLTRGHEKVEAHALWAAAMRDAPRMHTPLDEVWLDGVLAEHSATRSVLTREVNAAEPGSRATEDGVVERRQDWGEAPDLIHFAGRTEELTTLRRWVVEEHCRLAAVLGMGGIGKTALVSRLGQDAAPNFQHVYWRSLRDALPAGEWMAGVIGFLSAYHLVPPEGDSARLAVLLQLLRDQPTLLVLDNFETVLEPAQPEGRYRDGFAGYGALLRAVGESMHQSCLVVTSREAPPELAVLGGGAVRRFQLGGLGPAEGQVLLADKQLSGTDEDWANLVARFGGNGLALKVVGESIRELFDGDIAAFLQESRSGTVFGGIRRLLAEQIERSSALEQKLLCVLAVEREPVSLAELIADLGPRVRQAAGLEAVEALRRRSLVERAGPARMAAFTLQSVVLEYVTDRLVEDVGDEIARGQPLQLVDQPLIKAQAKDYVRQSQERLIGEPIVQQLRAEHGDEGAEQRLVALLDLWRNRPEVEQGYGPGNVVNLLRLTRGDLRGLQLSRLAIRQAYLAEVQVQDASLVEAHLAEAVLADVFSLPVAVALSGDGALLAAGTTTGEVWLWRVADRTLLATLEGHTGGARSAALSADGQLLASGGFDGLIRLWDASTGRLLATLRGHTSAVWGVALSADGQLLASCSEDGTMRLWDASDGRPLATLQGHTGAVWSVTLSADGQLLASGGFDGTVRLWQTDTGRLLATLHGHTSGVWGVALSADRELLATASGDGTARVWDVPSGRSLHTLQGHNGGVWGVALSADGQLLASGGGDGTVRLWDTSNGQPLATLQGHTGTVRGLTLSADGELLASGGFDGTVRLWEATFARVERGYLGTQQTPESRHSPAARASGWQPLAILQGHTSGVWSVALAKDGRLLASGSQDGAVRLWEASTGLPLATMEGHTGSVRGLALAADGRLLASSGEDGTVRLWDASSGRSLARLQGHTGTVWGVALSAEGHLLASGGFDGTARLWETSTRRLLMIFQGSTHAGAGHASGVWGVALCADGRLLASGSQDGAVRLWETSTGRLLTTLPGHTGGAWSVALSADGQLLASGGGDGTARLWDASTGRLLAILEGHTSGVWGVALSADGRLLASSGEDGTVRLWESSTARPVASLQGHTGAVWSVALSADSQLVASGSEDGTVRLWEANSGTCLHMLRSARRYEHVDITGLTGVTAAQRMALLALGAVERHGPPGEPTSAVALVQLH